MTKKITGNASASRLPAKPPVKHVGPASQPPKSEPAYELASGKRPNVSIGEKRSNRMPPIASGSSEAYLMRRALERLDDALGNYQRQVEGIEAEPVLSLAEDEVRANLINVLREVQGQMDSFSHHADGWFKDRPDELKNAKNSFQEYNTRFEALTRRANKAASNLHLPLHPQVPPRY